MFRANHNYVVNPPLNHVLPYPHDSYVHREGPPPQQPSNAAGPQPTRFGGHAAGAEPTRFGGYVVGLPQDGTTHSEPVVIDSADRLASLHPNPFEYRVRVTADQRYSGGAFIPARLDQVERITLKNVSLPKFYRLVRRDEPQAGAIFAVVSTKVANTDSDATLEAIVNSTDSVPPDTVRYANVEWERDPLPPNLLTSWLVEFVLNDDPSVLYSYAFGPAGATYATYRYDTNYNLDNERRVVVQMEDLNEVNEHATTEEIRHSFAVVYPYHSTDRHVFLDSCSIQKQYPNWNKNLTDLSVRFLDSNNKLLQINGLNTKIATPRTCICEYLPDGTNVVNFQCASHYIRHPYYQYIQNHLVMEVSLRRPAL